MADLESVFVLIPARGGSKGIPRKNIRLMAGKPLIAWTIEAALRANGIAAVIVSTEDEEIAEIARAHGAAVPFLRPATLAADETLGIEPVLHAVEKLPQYDAVLMLQPTSPLRDTREIEDVLSIAAKARPPAIVSVCRSENHPAWMYRMNSEKQIMRAVTGPNIGRRQDLEPIYNLNGAIYYANTNWLKVQRSFIGPGTLGYEMSAESSVDIDGHFDWKIAEFLLHERNRP